MNTKQQKRLDDVLNNIGQLCIIVPKKTKKDLYSKEGSHASQFGKSRIVAADILENVENDEYSADVNTVREITGDINFDKNYFSYNISPDYINSIKSFYENIPEGKIDDCLYFAEVMLDSSRKGLHVDNSLFNDSSMNSVAKQKYGINFSELGFSTDDITSTSNSRFAENKSVLDKNDRFYENYMREVLGSVVHERVKIAIPKGENNSLDYDNAVFAVKNQNDGLKDFVDKYGADNIVVKSISENFDAPMGKYLFEEMNSGYGQFALVSSDFARSGDFVKNGFGQGVKPSHYEFSPDEIPDNLKFTEENYAKWIDSDDLGVDFKTYMKSSDRIYGTGKRGDEFVESGDEYQSESSMQIID